MPAPWLITGVLLYLATFAVAAVRGAKVLDSRWMNYALFGLVSTALAALLAWPHYLGSLCLMGSFTGLIGVVRPLIFPSPGAEKER